MNTAVRFAAASAIALALATMSGWAGGEHATKDEAVAMVKKAAAAIKADGPQKAYEAFTSKAEAFHDRDLYVVVYDSTGKCLAHGSNAKLVGKDLIDAQDADGVYYIKTRMDLMKTKASFWQDYKFSDPLTKKLEPKSTYCEKLNDTVVCAGIYK
ncbi:signal transduction histidine kinase [Rhizomicrobium palustre]|uniref:Signal transduction histidine kinase n=1 Tax=Rhizomicrobium palustre TaxID=189966 RepID=A0A846N0F8_9PROT|nr:cache domain-containing protein [Rhizomicrobium palustre]NIK88732.1 signal transduction histidine kinase [Rhizomicrobium palustre]